MYQQNSLFRRLLRRCALVLVVVFSFTSVVQADTAAAIGQRSLPSSPNSSALLSAEGLDLLADFPAEFGTLKSRFQGKSGRYVIHIQDAHINEDAQKNIARLLTYFAEKHNLDLVNIEGAEGELATEYFKFVSNKEARKSVADYFLSQGRLSGTEYSVIVDQPDYVVNGVEDKALYDLNKQAYLDALGFKSQGEEVLAALHKTLNDVSRFVFSSEIRDLNAKRLVFQQSGHDLVAYVRMLQTLATKNKINLAQYLGMQALIELTELETRIDFEKAEKETEALIRDLKKALPPQMLSEYLTKTVHYRMKKLPRGQFYGYLGGVAHQVLPSESRASYQNALDYLRYIQSYENIDAGLFDEIANLDQAVRFAELATEDQKGLDHLWRIYDIASKLFDFTLTKDDAEFFFANRGEFASETFIQYLEPKLKEYHFSYGLPSLGNLDLDLARLEKFYDFAIRRDSVLIENALAKAEEGDHRVSALVTGGFHTPGIERRLREEGISYLVVTPKITKAIDQVKDAKLYEDAMKGVPLKIEKQIDQAMAAHKKAALNDPRFQLAAWTNFINLGETIQLDSLAGVMVGMLGASAGAAEVLSKQSAVSALPEGLVLQHALVDGQPYVRVAVGQNNLVVKVSPVLSVEGKRLSSNPIINVKNQTFELIQTSSPADAAWVNVRSEARGMVSVGDAYQKAIVEKNKQLLQNYGYTIPASQAASTRAFVDRVLRRENLQEILNYLKSSDFDGDFRFLRFGFENGTMPTLVARINAWNAAVASDLKALDVAETPEIKLATAKSIIFGFTEAKIKEQVTKLVESGLPVTTTTMKYSQEKISSEVTKLQVVAQTPAQAVVEAQVSENPIYLANLAMLENLLPEYGSEEGFSAEDFKATDILQTVEAKDLKRRIQYVINLLKGRNVFKETERSARVALLSIPEAELAETVEYLDTAEGELKLSFSAENLIEANKKDANGERLVLQAWAEKNIVVGEAQVASTVPESKEVKLLTAPRQQAIAKLEAALRVAEKSNNFAAIQKIQAMLSELNANWLIESVVAEDNERDTELEKNKLHRFYQARIDTLKALVRSARDAGNEALALRYSERWQKIRAFAVSPTGQFVSLAIFFLFMAPYAFGGIISAATNAVQDHAPGTQSTNGDQALAPTAAQTADVISTTDADMEALTAAQELFSDSEQLKALGVSDDVRQSGLEAIEEITEILQEKPLAVEEAPDFALEFANYTNELLLNQYGEEYRERLEGIANEVAPTIQDVASFEAAKAQLLERMEATFPVAEEPAAAVAETPAEEVGEELAFALESLRDHAAAQKLLDPQMQSQLDEHVAMLETKINNDADLAAAKASVSDKVSALNQDYLNQPVLRHAPEKAVEGAEPQQAAIVDQKDIAMQALDVRLGEVVPGFKKMLNAADSVPGDIDAYRNVILKAVFEGRETRFPDKHKTILVEWNLNPFRGALQSPERLLEKIEAGDIVVNPDFRDEVEGLVNEAGLIKLAAAIPVTPVVGITQEDSLAEASQASDTAILSGLPGVVSTVTAEVVRDVLTPAKPAEPRPETGEQGFTQIDVSSAVQSKEVGISFGVAGAQASLIGVSAETVGDQLTEILHLSTSQEQEQVAFKKAQEIRFYSERMSAFLVNETKARIHYLRDSGQAEDSVADQIDSDLGLVESIIKNLLGQVSSKAPEGNLAVLQARDYQQEVFSILAEKSLAEEESNLIARALKDAIDEAHRDRAADELEESMLSTRNAADSFGLPVYAEGRPLSFEDLLQMAVLERLKTSQASELIAEMKSKMTLSERKFRLSVIGRAGTDFASESSGAGLEASLYLVDPTKNERIRLAHYIGVNGELALQQEVADVAREVQTHILNYARAHSLEKSFESILVDLRAAEIESEKRNAENMDLNALSAIREVRQQIERSRDDRQTEKAEIKRLLEGLIGVVGYEINLESDLENLASDKNNALVAEIRGQVAEKLGQYGVQVGGDAETGKSLNSVIAQGRHAQDVLEVAYQQAREKMAVVFNLRIFYNFAGAFDLRAPLSFQRDQDVHDSIHYLERERLAIQYYQSAQAIEANLRDLRESAERAQTVAVLAEERFAEAREILAQETRRYLNEGGWSKSFKAAVEQYDLATRQREHAYEYQQQVQADIDRFTAQVSQTLEDFDRDFQGDGREVSATKGEKPLNAAYFKHLEAIYQAPASQVDATTLESSLQDSRNFNLRLEELRETELAERLIQSLSHAGVKLSAKFAEIDLNRDGVISENEKAVTVDDLQKHESGLFDEYDRATAQNRSWFGVIRDLFLSRPRAPEVILAEIEQVSAAKHLALQELMPGIMRGVWQRQVGYDEVEKDGTTVHVQGSLEAKIEQAQKTINSSQSSEKDKAQAQRDLRALELVLTQVREDLEKLGEEGSQAVFKGNLFARAGIDGIDLIPGAGGAGVFGVWDINKKFDGQIDFFYQAMRESELLQTAHARDFVASALRQRQFLEQIPLRIQEYEAGIQNINEMIALLEKQKETSTDRQKTELDRQINWAQFRLSSFAEAVVNLNAELVRAQNQYARALGYGVDAQVQHISQGAEAFRAEENFRSLLEKGMQSVPEAERRAFDSLVDAKVAQQRVRIQYALLTSSEELNYAQLYLMLPFVSSEGVGGSASYRAYSGHLSKDQDLTIASAEENLRRAMQEKDQSDINASLVDERLSQQIENTQRQQDETARLIRDLDDTLNEYQIKSRSAYASAGEAKLYTEIREIDRNVQKDNELIHQLNVRLLEIDRSLRNPVVRGEWTPDEVARMQAINEGEMVLRLTPEVFGKVLEVSDDQTAQSNFNLAERTKQIQEHYRLLRHAAVSAQAFEIPLGLGVADDFQYGARLTYDVLEALTDTQNQSAQIRMEQAANELLIRQDFNRRLIQLGLEDVMHARTISDIREEHARLRVQIAQLSNVGGALEDRNAIFDSVERTRSMVKTAANDREISEAMFRFLAGIPQDVSIESAGVNLLEQVFNGHEIGNEMAHRMLEQAFSDPRYQVILKNVDAAEADARQAWNKRWFDSQVGLFAGHHSSAGAELTIHLINQEKAAIAAVERAKLQLTEVQQDPSLRQIQTQTLNEYSAFVHNRMRLIQLAEDYIQARSRVDDVISGYRVSGSQGRTVTTMNDVLIALDQSENAALRLAEAQFAFRKSSVNLSRTLALMGLSEDSENIRTAGHRELPYRTSQSDLIDALSQARETLKELESRQSELSSREEGQAKEPEVASADMVYEKLSEPKQRQTMPARETYLDTSNENQYAPAIRRLWSEIFDVDVTRIERGLDGKVRGGLTEAVIVEDVFEKLFNVMQLNAGQQTAFLKLIEQLASSEYLKGRLSSEDIQVLMTQIPKNEKFGLNFSQVIEGLLANETLVATSQDATNSELDKQTDFRVLGIYIYYAASLLKGMDAQVLESATAEQLEQMVSSVLTAEFKTRLNRDFIFLKKVLENIAFQVAANSKSVSTQASPFTFTTEEINFLTQDGIFSSMVQVKDKRVDYVEWAAQEKELGSTESEAELKQRFVLRAFIDWFAYSQREVSEQPYFNFLTRDDTFEAFNQTRQIVNQLYRTNFGKNLALYGDIQDLSNITAWQFLTFMGKIYHPDEAVRLNRLRTIVLLASHVLEYEQVQLHKIYGDLSEADLREMPSAAMLRLLEQTAGSDDSFANQREINKERESLRSGLFFGEVIFRTIHAIEQYAQNLSSQDQSKSFDVGTVLDQLTREISSIGDESPALRVFDGDALSQIRRDIRDFYLTAPKIRDLYNQSSLQLKYPVDFMDPDSRGVVSAIYDFKIQNNLTDAELTLYFDYMAQLRDDVLRYHRVTQGIDFDSPEQHRLGRYPAVLSTEVLEMIHRGWSVEQMQQFINRKIMVFKAAEEHWTNRAGGSRLDESILGVYVRIFSEISEKYPDSGINLDSQESYDRLFMSINAAQFAIADAGQQLLKFLDLSEHPLLPWENAESRAEIISNVKALSDRDVINFYVDLLQRRDVPEGEAIYLGTERMFRNGEFLRNNSDLEQLQVALRNQLFRDIYLQAVYMTFNRDAGGQARDLDNAVLGYYADELERLPSGSSFEAVMDIAMKMKYSAIIRQKAQDFRYAVATSIDPEYKTNNPGLAHKVTVPSDEGGLDGIVALIYNQGLESDNPQREFADSVWERKLADLFEDARVNLVAIYQRTNEFPEWTITPSLVFQGREEKAQAMSAGQAERTRNRMDVLTKLDPSLMDLGERGNVTRFVMQKWMQAFGEFVPDALLDREVEIVQSLGVDSNLKNTLIEKQAVARRMLDALLLTSTNGEVAPEDLNQLWINLFDVLSNDLTSQLQTQPEREFEQNWRAMFFSKAGNEFEARQSELQTLHRNRQIEYAGFVRGELADFIANPTEAAGRVAAVSGLQNLAQVFYGADLSAEEAGKILDRFLIQTTGKYSSLEQRLAAFFHYPLIKQAVRTQFQLDLNDEMASQVLDAMVGKGLALSSFADASQYGEGGMNVDEAALAVYVIPLRVADLFQQHFGSLGNDPATWNRHSNWPYVAGLSAEITKRLAFFGLEQSSQQEILGNVRGMVDLFINARLDDDTTPDWMRERLLNLQARLLDLDFNSLLEIEIDRMGERLSRAAALQEQFTAIGYKPSFDRILSLGGQAYMDEIPEAMILEWVAAAQQIAKALEAQGVKVDDAMMRKLLFQVSLIYDVGLADNPSQEFVAEASLSQTTQDILENYLAELEALNRDLPKEFQRFSGAAQLTKEETAAVLKALQVRKVHPAMLKDMVRRAVDLRREILAEAVADARETSLGAVLFKNDYFVNRFRAPRGTYDLSAELSPFELLVAMDNLNSGSPDHLMLQQIAGLKSKDLMHVQRVLGAYAKYKTEKELVAEVGEEAVTQNWSGFEKGLLKLSRGEGVDLFGRTVFAGYRFSLMEMSGIIALAIGLSALMGFKLFGHHQAKKVTPENFDFKKLPRFFSNEKADALSWRYSLFRAAVVALVSWALVMLVIQMSYVMIGAAFFVFLLTFAVLWRVIPDVFILKVVIAPIAWLTGASKPIMIRYNTSEGKSIVTAQPRGIMRFIPKGFKSGPLGVVRNNGGAGDIENMETLFRDSATLLAESYANGHGDQNLIAQSVLQLQVNRLGDNPAIKASLKTDPNALKNAIAREHASLVNIWGEQDPLLDPQSFFSRNEDEQQKILVIKKLYYLRDDTTKRFNRIIAEVVDGMLAEGRIQGDRDAIIRDVTDRFSNPFTFTNVPKPDPYYKSMRFIYEGGEFFDPLDSGAYQKLREQPYLQSNPNFNPDPYVDQTLEGEVRGGKDFSFMNGFVGVIGGPTDEGNEHHIKEIQRRTMEKLRRPLLELVSERRADVFVSEKQRADTTAEDKKYYEAMEAISSDFETVLRKALQGLESEGVLSSGVVPEALSLRDIEDLYQNIAEQLELAVKLSKSPDFAQLSEADRKANAAKILNLFENLKKVDQVMVLILDGAQYRVLAFGEIHSSQIFDAGNSMLYAFYKRLIQYAMRSPSSIFQSRIKFVDTHKSMHASLMEDHPNNTLSFTQEALQAILKMVRAFGKFLIINDIFYITQARPFLKDFASKIRLNYGVKLPLSEDEFHSAIAEVQTGIGPQYVRDAEIGEDPTFNLSQRQKRAMARWTTFHDMYSYFRSAWMNNVYHAPVKSAWTHALLFGGTAYLFLKSIGLIAILGKGLAAIVGASAATLLSPALAIAGFVVLVAVLAVFYKSIQAAMQRQMDAGKFTLPSHREGGAEVNAMNNRGLVIEIFFLMQLIVMGAAMLSGSGIIIVAPVVGEILFGITMAALLLPKVLFAPIYEVREWILLRQLGLNPSLWDLFYRPVRAMAFGALEAVLSTMQLLMLVALMPGVVIKAYLRVQTVVLYETNHPFVVKDGILDKTLRKIYGWLEWGAPDSAAWTIAGINAENPPFKQVAWLFKTPFMLGTIFFMLWLSPVVPAVALTTLGYAISAWFAVHAIYGGFVVRRGVISVPSGLEEKKQQEWYVTRGDAVTAIVFALGLAAASLYLPGLASFVPADFITRTSTITIMSWFFGIFSVFVVGYNIIKVQASAIMKSKVLGKYVEFKYQKGLVKDSPENRKWTDLISWALFGIGTLGAWLFFQGSLPEFIKPALVFVQAVNTGDGSSLATFLSQAGYDPSLRVETKFSWFFNAMGGGAALLGPTLIIGSLVILVRTYLQKLAGLQAYERAELAKQKVVSPASVPASQKTVPATVLEPEVNPELGRLDTAITEIERVVAAEVSFEKISDLRARIKSIRQDVEVLTAEGQDEFLARISKIELALTEAELILSDVAPAPAPQRTAAEELIDSDKPAADSQGDAAEQLANLDRQEEPAPASDVAGGQDADPEAASAPASADAGEMVGTASEEMASSDSPVVPSVNLRGEEALVAGSFALSEKEVEVSFVGKIDRDNEEDQELAHNLFEMARKALIGKTDFDLQFARRIEDGNYRIAQQAYASPKITVEYKVFVGKNEMPFKMVLIQRSEARRSEVAIAAAASADAMRVEMLKVGFASRFESTMDQVVERGISAVAEDQQFVVYEWVAGQDQATQLAYLNSLANSKQKVFVVGAPVGLNIKLTENKVELLDQALDVAVSFVISKQANLDAANISQNVMAFVGHDYLLKEGVGLNSLQPRTTVTVLVTDKSKLPANVRTTVNIGEMLRSEIRAQAAVSQSA